jgi:hypothetical protein
MAGYSVDTMLRLSWFSGPLEQSWLYLQACCADSELSALICRWESAVASI